MPVIEFEGRKIEVPDDFTDAEISEVLAAQQPAAEPSTLETVAAETNKKGGIYAREARRGLAEANPISLAVDLPAAGIRGLLRATGLADVLNSVDPTAPGGSLEALNPGGGDFRVGSALDAILGAPAAVANAAMGGELTGEGPTPTTRADRIIGRIGYETGPAAASVGIANVLARLLGPAADTMANAYRPAEAAMATNPVRDFVTRIAPDFGRRVVGQVAQAGARPGNLATKELAYSAAAGTGAGVANEAAGNPQYGDNFWSDFLGSLAGVGSLAAGSAIGRGAADLTGLTFGGPKTADKVVGQDVVNRILERSSDYQNRPNVDAPFDTRNLAAALETPTQAERVIPGYQSNIGDRTLDPGLQTLAFDTDGAFPGRAAGRRTANEAAISQRIDDLRPQGDPAIFRDSLENARTNLIQQAEGQAGQAQQQFEALVEQLRPVMGEATARGSEARAALAEAYARAKAEVDTLYEAARDQRVRMPIEDLASRFQTVEERLPMAYREQFVPQEAGVPSRLVAQETEARAAEEAAKAAKSAGPSDMSPARQQAEQDFADLLGGKKPKKQKAPPPLKVGYDEVEAVRSALSSTIRREQSEVGRTQASRIADQFRTQVDEFVEENAAPGLLAKTERARAARVDLADRFERPGDALEAILRRREGGDYAYDDSTVPPRLTPTDAGKTDDFRAAMREAGDDPRLRGAIEDTILADIERRGLLGRPDQLDAYLQQRGVVLEQFPTLRTRLAEAGEASRAATTARNTADDTRAELTTPSRSPVAKYLQYGDASTRNAMVEVINSKDPEEAIGRLLETAGDTEATRTNARAAFWTVISKEKMRAPNMVGEERWNAKKLDQMLADPKVDAVARRLWSDNPGELDDLKEVFRVLATAEGSVRAGAPGSSGTAQILQNAGRGGALPSAESLSSRFRAVSQGRASTTVTAVGLMGDILRRLRKQQYADASNRVMAELVNNPGLAADLLRQFNPAELAVKKRMLTQKWGQRASTITNLLDETDTPEEEDK